MGQERRGAATAWALVVAAAALAPGAEAQEPRPRPTLNLYGSTGLIDMPTAEVQPDGQMSASYATFGETTRRNFSFQILPRVSATLRYATIQDVGRVNDPGYDLFDRSLDLRLQVFEEHGWRPSLAFGLRDFLGTGVYSAEYLVASKTVARDFTLTGGIGWGRLGSLNGFENPFCTVADSFCDRDRDFGEGGKPSLDTLFRGEEAALFGGVEWRTPYRGLTLKAEYSSDAYTREQRGPAADFERASPFNFGAEYRLREGLSIGGYYLYGTTVGVQVALSGNPSRPAIQQNLGPGPIPVNPRPANAPRGEAWAGRPEAREQLVKGIRETLAEEGVVVEQMRFTPRVVDIVIDNRTIAQMPKAIGRTARVLAVGLPPSVEEFRITPIEDGLPTTTVVIDRSAFEAQADRPGAGLASWESVRLEGAEPALGGILWERDAYPLLTWAVIPLPTFQLFAGDEGFRPQLNIQARATYQLSPRLSFSARLRQPVIGTYDDPDVAQGRTLPPVRREAVRYYAGADPKLTRLSGDYLFKLNGDTYARASAGYLERQFAGVSGEVLWKPVEQRWGLGLELNYVRQRDPQSFFGFRDYDVATGFASLYWDTGYKGIELQFDAGRYLAGDWGGTLWLTRYFANGWAAGAFVTRTNVTAEDFGEGSFDKGIVVSIPLRWATPFETRQTVTTDLRSLSSDGGARLDIANRLYPKVRYLDRSRLQRNWGTFWQ